MIEKIIKKLKYQNASIGRVEIVNISDTKFKNRRYKSEYLIRNAFPKDKGRHMDVFESMINESVGNFSGMKGYKDTKIIDVRKFKDDIQNYLKNCIEELELTNEGIKKTSGNKTTTIKIANKNFSIQDITIKNSIKNAIDFIKQNESDLEKVKEAEKKLKDLEKEISKKDTKWITVKDILKYFADFGKDVFLTILPIVLKHYGSQ
ncbi:MAG TPA: hypothetical protein P5060_01865 [Candidatus Absconditabacterales bacterium]|nr:hypothetical protein [Candidatus Absconditabacterales bacterium]